MKNLLLILLCIAPLIGRSQLTSYDTIEHDGLKRAFILYVPASYTGNREVPLLFNFHGYTSSAHDQMYYGDFRSIADTAGFIIVHPQGTLLNGATHWNVGGWTIGSTADDIGFTAALIDTLSERYQIDLTRIYATGMSNGGYMSIQLACRLSDRIAAVASVTGSMTHEMYNQCNPQRPVPLLQIHGTDDPVVPYKGASWTLAISEVLKYWVGQNGCDSIPQIKNLPDLNPNDGSTVEHIIYPYGEAGVSVEHLKITGGAHTWPGTAFGSTGTNYDINGSLEVWKFLSRYDIHGLRNSNTTGLVPIEKHIPLIGPNPSHGKICFLAPEETHSWTLFDLSGHRIQSGNALCIDLHGLDAGIYLLKDGFDVYKVVLQP